MKKETLITNSSLIFNKKVSNKHKTIALNYIINSIGPVKHFPPATKEWFNSIYAYNNNEVKGMSIADKNLSKLLKSYFCLSFPKLSKKKSRGRLTKSFRLNLKKILISRAELKHTNAKIIITVYVYNAEKKRLEKKIKWLASTLFPTSPLLYSMKKIWGGRKSRSVSFLETKTGMLEYYHNISILSLIKTKISYFIKELTLDQMYYLSSISQEENKGGKEKRENLLKSLEAWIDISIYCTKTLVNYVNLDRYYRFVYLPNDWLDEEIKLIAYYKLRLALNKYKFEYFLLSKLKPLVSDIYNEKKKEIEFNIVNLKTLYLNSDIFTQVIALKLKNRNNKLITVLRSALSFVKLPRVNLIRERYKEIKRRILWSNKVSNLKVNSLLLGPGYKNKDKLNSLLLDIFSHSFNEEKQLVFINNNSNDSLHSESAMALILKSLKHRQMAGVRLEAKGRLTKRFTASRSVFKIRWKGGIKNIDSSYKGLSSVLLRGHMKSSVQYSIINSKTRNGAYGLRGWIGSR